MISLPPKIKVGPYQYKVEEWERDDAADSQRWGECSFRQQTLRVDTHHSKDRVLVTTIHELLHAVFECWSISAKNAEDNEEVIEALAPGLATVLVDNPRLVDLIREMSHAGPDASE